MKNKKGFTLIEVIIVIVLLSLIAGIFAINMTGILGNNKKNENDTIKTAIISAAKSYISSNPEKVKNLYKGYSYVDITVGELRDEGLLSEDLKNSETGEIIPDGKVVRVTNNSDGTMKYEIFDEGKNELLIRYTLIAEDLYLEHDENDTSNWCESNNTLKGLGNTNGTDSLYFIDQNNEVYSGNYNIFQVNVKGCNVKRNIIGNYTIEYEYTYKDNKDEMIKSSTNRNIYVVPDKYTVSYDANTGEGELPKNQSVIWSQEYKITNVIPTKTGYTFLGWSMDKAATTETYKTNQKVIFKPISDSREIILYAIWKPNVYTITLDSQNAPTQGTKEIFETYNTKYSLTVDDEGMTTTSKPINLPKNPGYDFKGYFTKLNGKGEMYINASGYLTDIVSNTNFLSDSKLYAYWTPAKFWVKFNTNLNSIPSADKTNVPVNLPDSQKPEDRQYTYNSNYEYLPKLSMTGYTFKGWYTDPTAGNQITTSTIFKQVEDGQVLYAHWQVIKYTVTYNPNGGSGGPGSTSVYYGKSITIPSTSPSRSCYSFVEWQDSSSSKKYRAGNTYGPVTSAKTLNALWNYTCNYSYSGGGGGGSSSGGGYSSSSSSSCSISCQMQRNSEAWHQTTDQATRDALHAANVVLGAMNTSACGGSCSYNSSTGTWSTSSGSQLYSVSGGSKTSSSSSSGSSSSSSRSTSSSVSRAVSSFVSTFVSAISGGRK